MDATHAVHTAENAELRRLAAVVNKLEGQFREQRALLQKRGMSLPPGTLAGLQQVRAEMESLVRHYDESSTELQRLRELSRTSAVINSKLEIDAVLNEVMDTVITLTRAERGYLMLRNPESGELEFRVARNIEHRNLMEGEFLISNTIVREVAQTGVPVVTTNAEKDDRFKEQRSIVSYALRSILCVPLRVDRQVTGVVYADNRVKQGLFGEKEMTLLQTFADQAAVAIQNARLFGRLRASLAEITGMRDLLNNVFASIASGVITTDAQNCITTLNPAACRILNLEMETALGKPLSEVWPLIHPATLQAIREENVDERQELETEIPPRGVVNLELHLSPLLNAERTTEGVVIVVDDLTEAKQREAQLNVVRRYLPPAMVDNIQSIDALGLGGERRDVTTLFIDVRPFNTFASHLRPRDVMELLNRHLTVAADAVAQQRGVIDKYMGSVIMALFNTQLNPLEDHAWRALLSILNMAEDFRDLYTRLGEPSGSVYFRVGVHTGVATLGNVGSERRREFTAIGDAINLTSRLMESAHLGEIIVTEHNYRLCEANLSQYTDLTTTHEEVQVRGRRERVWVYRLRRNIPGPGNS